MRGQTYISLLLGTTLLLTVAGSSWAQDVPYVAGTNPSERPANAPVITELVRDQNWLPYALTGVSQPFPASLRFLENQGNWFTPFNHPGMLSRYDIRGWHAKNTQ
ncbi:hypothetical protein [Thiolinea disciformis]|uniref:hypothetical protein n=1 Tax=Thiolinea disciformis TaxID=125614 RepID=UPI00037EB2E2|nr:hypothetical protein [Thiolinea disciformis]